MRLDPDILAQNHWDGLRPPTGSLRARLFASGVSRSAARIGQIGHTAVAFAEARAQRRGGLTQPIQALLERLLRRAWNAHPFLGKRLLRLLRLRRPIAPSPIPPLGRAAMVHPSTGAAPIAVLRFLAGSVTRETIHSITLQTRLVHSLGQNSLTASRGPLAARLGAALPSSAPLFLPGTQTRPLSAAEGTPPAFTPRFNYRFEADTFGTKEKSSQQTQEPLWQKRAPRMEAQTLGRPPVPQASWLGVSPSAPSPAERLPLAPNRAATPLLTPLLLSTPPVSWPGSETLPRPSPVMPAQKASAAPLFTPRPLSSLMLSRFAPADRADGPHLLDKRDAPRRPEFRFVSRLLAAAAAFSFVQALPSVPPASARAAGASAPLQTGGGEFAHPKRLAGPVFDTSLQSVLRAQERTVLLTTPPVEKRASLVPQEMTEAAAGPRSRAISPQPLLLRQALHEPATRLPVNTALGLIHSFPFLRPAPVGAASPQAVLLVPALRPDVLTWVRLLVPREAAPAMAGQTRAPAILGMAPALPALLPALFLPTGLTPGAKAFPDSSPQGGRVSVLRSASRNAAETLPDQNGNGEERKTEAGSTMRSFPHIPALPLLLSPHSAPWQRTDFEEADVSPAARLPFLQRTALNLLPKGGKERNEVPPPLRAFVQGNREAGFPHSSHPEAYIKGFLAPGAELFASFRTLGRTSGATTLRQEDPPDLPQRFAFSIRQALRRLAARPLAPNLSLALLPRARVSALTPEGSEAAKVEGLEEAVATELQPPILALVRGFLSEFLGGAAASSPTAFVPQGSDQAARGESARRESAFGAARSLAARFYGMGQAVLPSPDLMPLEGVPEGGKAWTPGMAARQGLPPSVLITPQALRSAFAAGPSRPAEVWRLPPASPMQEAPAPRGSGSRTLTEAAGVRRSVDRAFPLDPPAALRAPAMVLPAPAAHSPADEGWAIQRVASGSPSAGRAGAKSPQQDINLVAEEKGAAANDVHLLANEVWSLLKRRLDTEAERGGRR